MKNLSPPRRNLKILRKNTGMEMVLSEIDKEITNTMIIVVINTTTIVINP
jgi:hypothetical protein